MSDMDQRTHQQAVSSVPGERFSSSSCQGEGGLPWSDGYKQGWKNAITYVQHQLIHLLQGELDHIEMVGFYGDTSHDQAYEAAIEWILGYVRRL